MQERSAHPTASHPLTLRRVPHAAGARARTDFSSNSAIACPVARYRLFALSLSITTGERCQNDRKRLVFVNFTKLLLPSACQLQTDGPFVHVENFYGPFWMAVCTERLRIANSHL
jgi:hypothetical protein